eukprot:TRINITY_DN3729_c0_g1_i1.p1 TRINITY_DN3729_c0_g1~~TRINITY_DN3729_c0_g1_i1.p1  ORF type:complete len:313 (+),score=29.99 TRINITY_DN3729_c0_g1_i1:42-941(+)
MEVDPNVAVQMMSRGGEFWKYHYRQVGRPSRVLVRMIGTGDDRAFAWKDVGDREFAALISVNDITEVRKGPGSRTFSENQASIINPNMCFTIYTRGRTLDLEAVHPEDLKIWVSGIRHLLSSAGKAARERDDTNYTYINSRTKEEWLYDGGRMVQHRERGPDMGGGRGHSDLLEDLERHMEMSCHTDPLDSIEEWLAMRRQTTRALGPPPEPLDVDQWFKAGPYRVEQAQPPAQIPAFPTPAGPPGPATHDDYRAGFEAGLRQIQGQPGMPGGMPGGMMPGGMPQGQGGYARPPHFGGY